MSLLPSNYFELIIISFLGKEEKILSFEHISVSNILQINIFNKKCWNERMYHFNLNASEIKLSLGNF